MPIQITILNRIIKRKKTIVVLHGWKEHFYSVILKKRIWRAVAAYVFNSAGFVFVLSEDFKEKLIKIGVSENKKVQDPYSFRCIPQVHGASKDTLHFVNKTFKTDLRNHFDIYPFITSLFAVDGVNSSETHS